MNAREPSKKKKKIDTRRICHRGRTICEKAIAWWHIYNIDMKWASKRRALDIRIQTNHHSGCPSKWDVKCRSFMFHRQLRILDMFALCTRVCLCIPNTVYRCHYPGRNTQRTRKQTTTTTAPGSPSRFGNIHSKRDAKDAKKIAYVLLCLLLYEKKNRKIGDEVRCSYNRRTQCLSVVVLYAFWAAIEADILFVVWYHHGRQFRHFHHYRQT